ncbi:MAG: triose-phosphate isomerase [Candidatus Kapabacteria bacterium]|nr:triose-phosphate isomerase [Candidatus Kapabacteria bacterium]
MRRKLIAGNWKMNTDLNSAYKLASEIVSLTGDMNLKSEVLLCPPFTSLFKVVEAVSGTAIKVGAQNCEYRESGAYTGEVSPQMISSASCNYVIIGHSERRSYYGETDETVNLKVKSALAAGLKPIVCIGETLAQREAGDTFKILQKQLRVALSEIEKSSFGMITIAYEPVWAIGTGVSASVEQAAEAHSNIRMFLRETFGAEAGNMRILYGGSMNEKNCSELLSLDDIDGGLIGGASLKADLFVNIIKAAEETTQ